MNCVIRCWVLCQNAEAEFVSDVFIDTFEALPVFPSGKRRFDPAACAKYFCAKRKLLSDSLELWLFPDGSQVKIKHPRQLTRIAEVLQ